MKLCYVPCEVVASWVNISVYSLVPKSLFYDSLSFLVPSSLVSRKAIMSWRCKSELGK